MQMTGFPTLRRGLSLPPRPPSPQSLSSDTESDSEQSCDGLVASPSIEIEVYPFTTENAQKLFGPRNCFRTLCHTESETRLSKTKFEYLMGVRRSDFILVALDRDDQNSVGGFAFVLITQQDHVRSMYVGLVCARKKKRNEESPFGIGTLLMQKIEELARDQGCSYVELFSEDEHSDGFYLNLGFKRRSKRGSKAFRKKL